MIAQHSDFSLVAADHPAKPGEYLVMYLAGMGATNPTVPSGQPSPAVEPLARVMTQPAVTVDGQNAAIVYAGLTPGAAGLYQINFQVPLEGHEHQHDRDTERGYAQADRRHALMARFHRLDRFMRKMISKSNAAKVTPYAPHT